MNSEMRQEANDIQRTNTAKNLEEDKHTGIRKEKMRRAGSKVQKKRSTQGVHTSSNQDLSWTDVGGPARGRAGPGPVRQLFRGWAAARSGPSIFQRMGGGPA